MIFYTKFKSKISLAKIPKTLYDGRVRKVFLGIFLFFIITILFSKISLAQTSTPLPLDSGTCEVKQVSNPSGRGVKEEVINKCAKEYKPNPIFGTTDSCTCVPESMQICSKQGKSCTVDTECTSLTGCENYMCFGAIKNRTLGTCKDKNIICSKAEQNCLQDSFCKNEGEPGCAGYTCWSVGRGGKACKLGQQPTPIPTPTPTSPFPPCAQWKYSYPKDNLNSRLNDEIIPTGNPEYINPDFKTRKCVAIQTGIGEISTEPQGFVKRIFSLVLGLAGGIALILIIISGYRIMASQGNPEALAAGRQQLVGAIVGLLFIIFSFVILQIIGVDILHIPGFKP